MYPHFSGAAAPACRDTLDRIADTLLPDTLLLSPDPILAHILEEAPSSSGAQDSVAKLQEAKDSVAKREEAPSSLLQESPSALPRVAPSNLPGEDPR